MRAGIGGDVLNKSTVSVTRGTSRVGSFWAGLLVSFILALYSCWAFWDLVLLGFLMLVSLPPVYGVLWVLLGFGFAFGLLFTVV